MTAHALGDAGVLLGRSLRHVTRSLDTIITTVVTPVAMRFSTSWTAAATAGASFFRTAQQGRTHELTFAFYVRNSTVRHQDRASSQG
jgi:hypothetical protein